MKELRKAGEEEVMQAIMGGITFRCAKTSSRPEKPKIKTKAKKKSYITGQHGSASAAKKAAIREKRANRHKKS